MMIVMMLRMKIEIAAERFDRLALAKNNLLTGTRQPKGMLDNP